MVDPSADKMAAVSVLCIQLVLVVSNSPAFSPHNPPKSASSSPPDSTRAGDESAFHVAPARLRSTDGTPSPGLLTALQLCQELALPAAVFERNGDLHGYNNATLDFFRGTSCFDRIVPAPIDHDVVIDWIQEVAGESVKTLFATGKSQRADDGSISPRLAATHPKLSPRPAAVVATPIRESLGAIVGAFVTFREIATPVITAPNPSEVPARRSQVDPTERAAVERFHAIYDQSAIGLCECGLDGRFFRANAAFCRMLGYSEAELLEKRWQDVTHPDDLARDEDYAAQVVQGQIRSYEMEKRYLRKDGTSIWVALFGTFIRDAEQQIVSGLGLVVDLTAKKATEKAVSERDADFSTLADSIPQLAWMVDAQGNVQWYNRRWYKYTRMSSEHGLQRGADFLHPETSTQVRTAWDLSAREGTPFEMEFPLRGADGNYRWFLTRMSPVRDRDGKITRWFGTNTDVHELRNARDNLRESRERLSAALIASGTGTFRWDFATNHLSWDEALDALFGLPPGKSVHSLDQFIACVHPEDRARVIENCVRCKERGDDFDQEFRVVWPDGSIHWLDDKGKTFFDASGHPTYMTGACITITDRKNAEADLEAQRRRWDYVISVSQVGFWFCDLPFDKLNWDARVKEIFWLPPDSEVTIDLFYERLHPDDRQRTRKTIEESIRQHARYDIEYRTVSPDGRIRWARAIGSGDYDASGLPTRFDGVIFDITDLVAARTVLEQRHEQMEKLVAERTAKLRETIAELESFSYSISHDLRAPLRAMQSFATMLEEDFSEQINSEGKEYIRRIVTASQRMDRLIQDVLTYSRISREEVRLQRVSLDMLLKGILESYPHFTTAAGAIEIVRPLGEVIANEAALTQCLSNLIGNALKFGRPEVALKIRISTEHREGNRIRVAVEDNGIGIDPDAHAKVWEVFYQLSNRYGGTGIGLAIVRKAAERMGGAVGLSSQPGVGSTFWIELNAPS